MNNNVVFRVSASPSIGIGHLMRCLTLARIIKPFFDRIHFMCNRDLSVEMSTLVLKEGFILNLMHSECEKVLDAKKDSEEMISLLQGMRPLWLVVDHYQIEASWEKELKLHVGQILVIDDLANRDHACDVLLDQNLYPNSENRYKQHMIFESQLFLGPENLLLRPEFYGQKKSTVRHKIKNIMVNFGGSDPTDEISKLLEMILHSDHLKTVCFHIVAGPSNLRKKEISMLCQKSENIFYYDQVKFEIFLRDMDLAIGAGGVTMWERCFMGVPSGVIVVAENQVEAVEEAAAKGLIWNLGRHNEISKTSLLEFLNARLKDPESNAQVSEKCLNFMGSLKKNKEHPIVLRMKEAL